MSRTLILIFTLCLTCYSCKKDEPEAKGIEKYVGIYDGTKSSSSYDDPLAVSIEVVVERDSTDNSLIIINGMKVPVNLDGTYGPDVYEGNHMYPAFIIGQALPCYIKGTKL